MDKFDFKKEYKSLYSPKQGAFSEVTVPAFMFLRVDGEGDPNTSEDFEIATALSLRNRLHREVRVQKGNRKGFRGGSVGRPVVGGRHGCVHLRD